jgi:hypothetical protein
MARINFQLSTISFQIENCGIPINFPLLFDFLGVEFVVDSEFRAFSLHLTLYLYP